MRIKRILLENYRGIASREVEFTSPGINLLIGPNEAGKSSVFEAFALLLGDNYKHTSKHRDVADTRPVGVDAATVVEAEFQVGPWEVVYRKQFHRNTGTELRILAPRPAQFAGGEAHSRMAEILGEHLDLTLFNALQVLQGAPAGQVELSDSSALSAALDSSGGSAADLESSESLLQHSSKHFLRYWTASGQKSKDHRELLAQLDSSAQKVSSAKSALAEVTELARQNQALQAQAEAFSAEHTRVKTELAELSGQVEAAQVRQAAAEQLTRRKAELEQLLTNAEQLHAARTAAVQELTASENALPILTQEQLDLVSEAQQTTKAVTAAKAVLDSAENELDELQLLETNLARAAQLASQHREWQHLKEQVSSLDQAQQELEDAAELLASTPAISRQQVLQAEELWQRQTELSALQRAAAGSVQVTPLRAGVEVQVDQESRVLEEPLDLTLSKPLTLTVPGELTFTYSPAAAEGAAIAQLEQVQLELSQLLSESGCVDVAALRAGHQEYERIRQQQEATAKRVATLANPAEIAQKRAELKLLTELFSNPDNLKLAAAAQPGVDDPTSGKSHPASSGENLEQMRAAVRESRSDHGLLATLAATASATAEAAAVALDSATSRVNELKQQLATQRAATSDRALEGEVARFAAELSSVTSELEESRGSGEDAQLLHRANSLKNTLTALADQLEEARDKATQARAQLDLRAADGRHDDLQQAESSHARLSRQAEAYQSRAASAKHLFELLSRHRSLTKQNYVAPLRRRIEQLGQVVFGPTFEVEVDDTLVITHRTLAGTTLGVDQLSTGAKEQLGVLLRLASAGLVDPDGAVPVVLDDALGATDSGRLRQLAGVIDQVALSQQVIILTSAPQRYAALSDIHQIDFT